MEFPGPPSTNCIRILGIDPGTTTCGLGVIDVDIDSREPSLVYYRTIDAKRAVKLNPEKAEICGGRDVRLDYINSELALELNMLSPTIIAAESPFLGRGRVEAFEALVESFARLRDTVWKFSCNVVLRRIDPITVKAAVGVSHIGTEKIDVYNAVVSIYKDKAAGIDLGAMDEHSTDAVAVAHFMYRKFVKNDLVLKGPSKKKQKPKKNDVSAEEIVTKRKRRSRKKRKRK